MYSTLMLAELAKGQYATRLAEAERYRQRRQLTRARAHHTWAGLRAWHLPWPGGRRRRTPSTMCIVGR